MANKKPGQAWVKIIETVKTPLGYFTLALLIVEVILGTLAMRATGDNFTHLVDGMLAGFLALILIVFCLTVSKRLRRGLLGTDDESFGARLREMNLSKNDLRVLFSAANRSGDINAAAYGGVVLDADAQSADARLKKFQRLGLVEPGQTWDCLPGYVLTRDGTELATFIKKSLEATRDLKEESLGGRIVVF